MADTKVKKTEPTPAEKFLSNVESAFQSAMGEGVTFTDYEKRLAQNMYVMIDKSLKDFEAKRSSQKGNNKAEFVWANINGVKLAIDSVHRIRLGLDALIPNFLHAIPYWNSKKGLYDLDLRVGYRGKHYYRCKVSKNTIKDIRYQLVYKTDKFEPLPKQYDREVESYKFDIKKPFDRGEIIGGFGYIVYEEQSLNKLVMVSEELFLKLSELAQTPVFWKDYGDKMRMKTIVHQTTEEIDVDPEKVNESYHYVEKQDRDEMFSEEVRQPVALPTARDPETHSFSNQDEQEKVPKGKTKIETDNEEIFKGTPFEDK